MAFDLRYRVGAGGVITPRHFSFGALLLKQSLRFIVAIRIPMLGDRSISVPLKILLKHSALGSV